MKLQEILLGVTLEEESLRDGVRYCAGRRGLFWKNKMELLLQSDCNCFEPDYEIGYIWKVSQSIYCSQN